MESLLSRRDLDFQLYEVLDTEALCQRPRYAEHNRETFTAIRGAAEEAESVMDLRLQRLGMALSRAAKELETTTRALVGGHDLERAVANAFPYLVVFGHTVVGWLWVEQALAAHRGLERGHDPNPGFYDGKFHAAQYFFDWVVAGARSTHDALRRLDDTALAMKAEWF